MERSIEEATDSQSSGTNSLEAKPKLNHKNWLNLFFYIGNFVVTYGVGTLGWLPGTDTTGNISDRYQTIVSPNSTAFLIWSIIFLMQAVFAVLQMLPRYRAKAMIQEGVGYWYAILSFFQMVWSVAFAYEIIWLALVLITLIWLGLVGLIYSQYYTKSEGSLVEFWLLRFPFALHCGWLTAASTLNVNVLAVDLDWDADSQLATGIISLAYLHAVSVWVLFGFARPNYTIACVLAWAFSWINVELQNPKQLILDTFHEDIINGVANAARGVAFIILAQVVVRASYQIYKRLTSSSEEEPPQEKHILNEDV